MSPISGRDSECYDAVILSDRGITPLKSSFIFCLSDSSLQVNVYIMTVILTAVLWCLDVTLSGAPYSASQKKERDREESGSMREGEEEGGTGEEGERGRGEEGGEEGGEREIETERDRETERQLSMRKVPNVCGGSASGENACPATWPVSEFGRRRRIPPHQEGFSWPDTRTTSAFASGQHKRSVGHASFVCGSAERNSNCNRCFRDCSAQPREENNNDNTSMQQRLFSPQAGVCGMSHWEVLSLMDQFDMLGPNCTAQPMYVLKPTCSYFRKWCGIDDDAHTNVGRGSPLRSK